MADCNDPPASWKTRELLQQEVAKQGWTVQKIEVDDGWYLVSGLDRAGNKVKAKYAPSTLRVRTLEVDFGQTGNASDYLHPGIAKATSGTSTNPATSGKNP